MRQKFNPREDYYARLNIQPTATLNDIKRAYRRLALKTHPDVNKERDATDKFKKVCEAYKILSDPDLRRQYDLSRGFTAGGGGKSTSSSWTSSRGPTGASESSSSRQWYDQYDPTNFRANRVDEETAETIDDSFGKIFNDFMGTVATRGGRGIFEDFVDFLEQGVDGFGDDSDQEFDELLRTEDLSEIQAEIENLNFLILKLREKLHKAQADKMVAETKLRSMQSSSRDMGTVDKRLEVVEKAAALKARVQDLEGHIKRADKRQRRLMLRAEELRWGKGGVRSAYDKYASPGYKGSASSRINTQQTQSSSGTGKTKASESSHRGGATAGSSQSSAPASSNSVEEELQKLKKQMGL